jgi:hypothetical protein|tara:strand:+ start:88 stop:522 length:435 start_codon:yes stop_codon:yes gene_type:complete
MKLNLFLLLVLCLNIASHEAPKNDEEKQYYVDNFIEIFNIQSQYIDTYLDDFAVPAFKYSIKNNGTETISTLWVKVYFLDKNGDPFYEDDYLPISDYSDMKLLKPNYTFRMETNKYMTVKEINPKEWSKKIKIEVIIDKLEFLD